jgi:hypothetical protein
MWIDHVSVRFLAPWIVDVLAKLFTHCFIILCIRNGTCWRVSLCVRLHSSWRDYVSSLNVSFGLSNVCIGLLTPWFFTVDTIVCTRGIGVFRVWTDEIGIGAFSVGLHSPRVGPVSKEFRSNGRIDVCTRLLTPWFLAVLA